MTTNHFVYKLIPPRLTFATDQTADESAIMAQHAGYWARLFDQDRVVAFGPVADPAGMWGLAVVAAENEGEVQRLGESDPAVISGMATFSVFLMPIAIVRSA